MDRILASEAGDLGSNPGGSATPVRLVFPARKSEISLHAHNAS